MAGIFARTTWRACGWCLLVASAVARATAAEPADLGAAPLPPAETGDLPNASAPKAADDLDNLLKKDIGELSRTPVVVAPALETHVSTVNRTESTVGKSPAAVFVITNDMIRRSGAKTIPDVLRMAPGVEVARIDANKWAVSVRGYNGRWANKLLVQIDGRSVYTPLYAGVFWDVQDVLLEDVERIEVIRGPGATVWGANAVNGVINIITKDSRKTQGSYVEAGAGTEELGFASVRQGGRMGEDITYRVYGKWFERSAGVLPGETPLDDWRQARGGFRMDQRVDACNAATLQGDYYNGYSGDMERAPYLTPPYVRSLSDTMHVSGQNVLYRWTHTIDDDSDWRAQVYYDRTQRNWAVGFLEDRDTVDFDFQYRLPLDDRQKLIWGFGYRLTQDSIVNHPPNVVYNPPDRSDDLFSYFVQDEITLRDDLWFLTVGSKFEHNDYTNFEFQPTVRLLCTPDKKHSLWGAVSRAVRTPSRTADDATILFQPIQTQPVPVFPYYLGNRGQESEDLLAYEIGFREQTTERFSWDLSLFFHHYDNLMTNWIGAPTPGPGGVWFLPLPVCNAMRGEVYGAELAVNYRPRPTWRIDAAYTFLQIAMHSADGAVPIGVAVEGESPRNQFYLQSGWDIGTNVEFDWVWRYVDTLPTYSIPAYFVMDCRLAWRPRRNLEVAVVGRNLLDSAHQEFGSDSYVETVPTAVPRSVYGQITWRY